jgi:hypothetical protein
MISESLYVVGQESGELDNGFLVKARKDIVEESRNYLRRKIEMVGKIFLPTKS